jgi:membrane-bound lytic murein transglycosylase B
LIKFSCITIILAATVFSSEIYSQEFRNLLTPRPKYLYEYREIYLSKLRDSLHAELTSKKVGKGNISRLNEEIFYRTLHYNVYKHKLGDNIDTAATLDFIQKELSENDYFKNRLAGWKDSTVIEYLTFAVELNIIKKHFSEFDLEGFKKTDAYKSLRDRMLKDTTGIKMMDSVLIRIKKIGFEPLNFYYRPNSIQEQFKADKFDINKFNFKEMTGFMEEHKISLDRAEQQYKVNKEIIVAILRKETNLGKYPLKFNPFEVLLGQSLFSIENPAADIAQRTNSLKRISRLRESAVNSLYNMIRYAVENSLDPNETKSNFVGAVGFTQFMPFNLHLARDGNGDGHADLMNMDDAIMSIGNFLNSNGWTQFYAINPANRKKIINLVLRYNSNDSYAEAVFEIAAELVRLKK